MRTTLRRIATLGCASVAMATTCQLATAAPPTPESEAAGASGFSAAALDTIKARAGKATAIAQRIRASSAMDEANYLSLSQALLGASDAGLAAASSATTYREAMAALRMTASSSEKLVGDLSRDFVFYPIVPCRLLDTRANGIMLTPAVPFPINFDGGNPGNAAGCTFGGVASQIGGALGTGVSRSALLINLTVTQPVDGPGFLQVRPVGTTNVTSNINYSAGQTIANMAVVQDAGTGIEFELFSQVATHAVIDVMGLFAPPAATPLDCVMMNGPDTSVPAGSGGTNSLEAACPAGYTEVAKYCRTNAFGTVLQGFNGPNFNGACNWSNPTAAAKTVNTDIRCCRIPGR